MDKAAREKLRRRLEGFDDRQRQRNEQRAEETRRTGERRLMNAHGTIQGARAYLARKGVGFEESVDPISGRILVTIPRQIVLIYDASGRYLASGPAKAE